MNKPYKITAEGKKALELNLASLISRRSSVANKIAAARDFGDLSENAEYDVAREEQGFIETKISEIEDILLKAEIIKNANTSFVELGSTVELKTGDKRVVYTIVGPVEANPLEGKISNKSPIGEALFGKRVGDKVVITTPKINMGYEISSIN